MRRASRALVIAVAMCGGVLTGLPAQAQTGWTFKGVDFPKRDGWCPKQLQQGGSAVIEIRPCNRNLPYLTAMILDPGNGVADWDLDQTTKSFADDMEGPDGGAAFAEAIAGAYGACQKIAMSVDRSAVPGVSGASLIAKMRCTQKGATQVVDFKNFNAYAQTRSGVLWCITFDYPDTPLSDDDKAMIRDTANRITATP